MYICGYVFGSRMVGSVGVYIFIGIEIVIFLKSFVYLIFVRSVGDCWSFFIFININIIFII